MLSLPQERSEHVVRRVKIDDIIRVRDRRHTCPNCYRSLRYKRIKGMMAKWAPLEYAWFCEKCPFCRLDGTIKPDEETTWNDRMKIEERSRVFSAISSAFRSSPEKK